MEAELNSKTYLPPRDAAAYLRVSELTLKYWRHKAKGPKYRKLPNGKVDYRTDWLDEFSERHVVEPSEAA